MCGEGCGGAAPPRPAHLLCSGVLQSSEAEGPGRKDEAATYVDAAGRYLFDLRFAFENLEICQTEEEKAIQPGFMGTVGTNGVTSDPHPRPRDVPRGVFQTRRAELRGGKRSKSTGGWTGKRRATP